jgi:SPX domain protein involved in polyphosphate accumulation
LTLDHSIKIEPPKTTPKRVELKQEISGLLKKLGNSPLFFENNYHKRVINSIYFDSHALATFGDSISGNKIRKKQRLRWYDSHSGTSNVVYEIKCKDSQLS